MIPENYCQRIIQFARQGYTTSIFPEYDTDWDSDSLSDRVRAKF